MALFLTALYLLRLPVHIIRPLWYDELLTYYVAKSNTWERFVTGIAHADFNPPLQHMLTHVTMAAFGDNPLAVRLPSIGCFLIASLCLYYLVFRRLGTWYASFAVLIFWSSGWYLYSYEARPYALLLACYAGVVICWQHAVAGGPRKTALWGLAACVTGLLLSHFFAAILMLSLAMAEAVRWWQRRKPDFALWMAVAIPCIGAILLYRLIIRRAQMAVHPLVYPADFVTSWTKVFEIYRTPFEQRMLPLALGISALLALVVMVRRKSLGEWMDRSSWLRALPEFAFWAMLLLMPAWIHLLMQRYQAPLWPRYGIGYGFTLGLVLTSLLGRFSRRNLLCAAIPSILLVAAIGDDCFRDDSLAMYSGRNPFPAEAVAPSQAWYREVHPELPFVCNGGLTFVEMNQRESPEFLKRVYYLNDPGLAVQYAHATIFETLPILMGYTGGLGHAVPYHDFIQIHRRFVVLGTASYPEDWLLRELWMNGASVKPIAQGPTGYRDVTLFEITLPDNFPRNTDSR